MVCEAWLCFFLAQTGNNYLVFLNFNCFYNKNGNMTSHRGNVMSKGDDVYKRLNAVSDTVISA